VARISQSPPEQHPSFERTSGYDEAHERALVDAITTAITNASMVSDPRCMVLRTGEVTAALLTCLASAIALSPSAVRSPTAIRQICGQLRRRLIKRVGDARADADFRDLEAGMFRSDDKDRGGRA
jgi:hypothetical protein